MSLETCNQERMKALCHLIKLNGSYEQPFHNTPEWKECREFLEARKLNPHNEVHEENIKQLFEAINT